MKKFELVLLFNPELNTKLIDSELNTLKEKLKTSDGVIINEENWGLRDLSYSINKFKKAFYNFLQIEIPGNIVKDISKDLNQKDNILRYIFVKVNKHQELPTKLNNEKK